jgi:hypothetical protein
LQNCEDAKRAVLGLHPQMITMRQPPPIRSQKERRVLLSQTARDQDAAGLTCNGVAFAPRLPAWLGQTPVLSQRKEARYKTLDKMRFLLRILFDATVAFTWLDAFAAPGLRVIAYCPYCFFNMQTGSSVGKASCGSPIALLFVACTSKSKRVWRDAFWLNLNFYRQKAARTPDNNGCRLSSVHLWVS